MFYCTLGFSFASADFENLTKFLCGFPCAKSTCKIKELCLHSLQLAELHHILLALLC